MPSASKLAEKKLLRLAAERAREGEKLQAAKWQALAAPSLLGAMVLPAVKYAPQHHIHHVPSQIHFLAALASGGQHFSNSTVASTVPQGIISRKHSWHTA